MTVTWFPCYLQPISVFSRGLWEARPGIKVGPISDSEKALLSAFLDNLPFKERFDPNCLVQIDSQPFTDYISERLRAQGYDTQKILDSMPEHLRGRLPVVPAHLLRWVIMSLSLCRSFNEISLPAFSYGFRHGDKPGQLTPAACNPTQLGYDRSFYTNVSHHPGLAGPLDLFELNQLAAITELYYQPVVWRSDPVSVALSCYWSFLFSRFPDQAYTSLVTVLEALLSTGTAEIAHQISERVAVLIGRSSTERLKIYHSVKKLYDLRSRITHGDLEFKKGVISWNTTVISAKMTIVSIPTLTEVAQYVTAVLCCVLKSAEIMSAMDRNKGDRKKMLDEYFLTRLFGN